MVSTCTFGMQKSTMHSAEPRSFSMPMDKSALEHLFYERFVQLDSTRRAAGVSRVRDHLAAGMRARTASVGADLASMDLHDDKPVSSARPRAAFSRALRMLRDMLTSARSLHGPNGLIPLQPLDHREPERRGGAAMCERRRGGAASS